jgi:F-type H+-transporting ATPase subunit epsilon
MASILLTIVTPEKQLLSEEVSAVNIPTTVGEIGVLPGHVPLYAQIKSGELMYKKDGVTNYYVIHGGFVEVEPDQVRILTHDAVRAEDLDEAVIEEARRKAQQVMEAKVSEEEFVAAEAAMRRALLELRVASRRKR